MSKVKKASRRGVWGRSRNPLPAPPPLTPPHSLAPLISEDFLPSRSIWRKLWICRDLFYSSYNISWLGICASCRKKLAMLMIVQLLSTKIVHFYDKSMKLCQITTNPKTNISGYGAKPNSTLDTSTAQALKWPT